ncbi:AraC family transcriptional regulator [Burkholderia sp. SG-MS1]|uniref:AraC family transcriptional regulator n=1 Tax=Paraburkholderia sp. SG-MS1 TaxID=2023741 RepID=UPI001445311C|nr:AraC family transcriptional regulator [Paraburkholderia sp. SG-MS1]NKJ45585.1 AraC family transcriptional regulator [Paraburkholderia sp. SG-MS1]
MDPLSDVLALSSMRGAHFAGLKTGGQWAISFPPPEGMKFNAIVEGACFLSVDGVADPLHLRAGDCFLLTQPLRFALASDLTLERADAADVFRTATAGVARYGADEDVFLIGGAFSFTDEVKRLLEILPPVVVINGTSDSASVLQWALQRLAHELTCPMSGSSLMARNLGHMMLIQVLRLHAATARDSAVGWLFALTDSRINAVIEAIHAEPACRWTVAELAALAVVSRSTFAYHFRKKVGHSPLDYVTRWRIHLACRELRMRDGTISSIAQTLGYDSDSAFSSAFKRVMTFSPKEYRARQRGLADANPFD